MPTSRKKKHGSPKPRRPKPLVYDPVYTDGLTPDLRSALKSKLTLPELVELEKQLRRQVEAAEERAIMNTHTRTWAVVFRVLHDRFGWGQGRKLRLWDAALDYLEDIRQGRLSPDDLLSTLEADGIRIRFTEK